MTSPSLLDQPLPKAKRREENGFRHWGVPSILFTLTMLSTTAVGMRYMHNFRLGLPPLVDDTDLLPFAWVLRHWSDLASGLPFSLTLIAILLAHEFGHYFACRFFAVRSTLPYLLPAPSLSGTFGAVIRLRSVIRSRAALMVIGAAGPVAGFVVALGSVAVGLGLSRYAAEGFEHHVQAPLILVALHALIPHPAAAALNRIIPHPVLIASWIGLLITSLNLIPAGQLDGGHILYALSPTVHRWSSKFVIVALLALGLFQWAGWMMWAVILMLPAMRHPRVSDSLPLAKWQVALAPVSLVILLLSATVQPFHGFGLLDSLTRVARHWR